MDWVKNKDSILLGVKILLSIFITYLIMFKGDAGLLIHNIGAFFVGGNYIIGLSLLANITVFYVLAMYNLVFEFNGLKKNKNSLIIFDIILVLINLLAVIYIACQHYQMPVQDALSKYIVLAVGAAVIYYVTSILFLFITSGTKNKLSDDFNLNINNNPFIFTGKMGRRAYLITKIVIIFLWVLTLGVV